MYILLRNFLTTLRRFKLASTLNLLGLSAAFAAFYLLLVQVSWDLGFDRSYPGAERIFRVENNSISDSPEEYGWNLCRPYGESLSGLSPDIEAVGCIQDGRQETTVGRPGHEESFIAPYISVSPSVIDIFGYRAVAGDLSRLGEPRSVILSESLARRLFGGDPAVGQALLTVDTVTVVGVFADFPANSSVRNDALVLDLGDKSLNSREEWSCAYFVRLRDASCRGDVERLMYGHMSRLLDGEEVTESTFRLTPLPEIHFAQDIGYDNIPKASRSTTYVLLAIAVLIVVIALLNFVNFFMALAPVRIRAVNLSQIFGASRPALRSGIVFESVGTTLLACGLAMVIVLLVRGTPVAGFVSGSLWPVDNLWLTGLLILLSVGAGLLAGFWPAWYITRFPAALVLRGSFGRSRAGQRLRYTLVSVQFVISIILIICALFVRLQTTYMQRQELGFDRDHILVANISSRVAGQQAALVSSLRSDPGIRGVAFGDGPLVSDSKMGWGRPFNGEQINFDCFPVSWDFLRFMGIPVTDGRDFLEEDGQKEQGGVYIFNENAARQYGIKPGGTINGEPIVGICRDFNFRPLQYGVGPIAFYVRKAGWWHEPSTLYVRASPGADLGAIYRLVEQTVRRLDPAMPEVNINTFDAEIARLYDKEERLSSLISLFSLLAILISLVGVFGLVVFETQYRRKEIGIRRVNGATVADILGMLNKGFVRTVAVCFLIAAPVAWYGVERWLEGFAYRTPVYWWVFVLSLLVVLAITLLTVTVQSWRAATANPVGCLKAE